MAQLNEAMADDRRIRDHLAQLNANILQLSDDLRADRSRQNDIMVSELRSLSSSIAALVDGNIRQVRRGRRNGAGTNWQRARLRTLLGPDLLTH